MSYDKRKKKKTRRGTTIVPTNIRKQQKNNLPQLQEWTKVYEIYKLYVEEGVSTHEIAERLETSVSEVNKVVTKALHQSTVRSAELAEITQAQIIARLNKLWSVTSKHYFDQIEDKNIFDVQEADTLMQILNMMSESVKPVGPSVQINQQNISNTINANPNDYLYKEAMINNQNDEYYDFFDQQVPEEVKILDDIIDPNPPGQ